MAPGSDATRVLVSLCLGTQWLLSESPAEGATCLSIQKTVSCFTMSLQNPKTRPEKIGLKGSHSHVFVSWSFVVE